MTVERIIHDMLAAIVGAGKVFPDVAPLETVPPYAVFQQVGGQSITFMERAVPSIKNGRFQITVWSATRADAAAKALAIESAFIMSAAVQAEPLGSAVADTEEFALAGQAATRLYAMRQDFSVWSDR